MRRHRPRGRLAALLVWFAAVVALAVAGWVVLRFLDRPATRAWLAAEVAREAARALQQPVSIGDLRLSVIPPRVALTDIAVGTPASPFLTARVAEIAIGKVHVAEREVVINQLRLVGVRIHGQLPAMPGGGSSGGWVGITIRQLEAEDVKAESVELGRGVVIKAAEFEARWSGSPRRPIQAAVVRVADFTLVAPGVEAVTGSVEGWGRATPRGWEIGRLRGEGPGWQVAARGAMEAGVLAVRGRATVDLGGLDRILRIGAGLDGEVDADWRAEIGAKGFRVDTGLRATRASVVGFVFGSITGEAHVSPDGLEATLVGATFAGGTLTGSYSLESFGPPWEHHVAVRGDGISLAGFLARIDVDAAGLAASCRVSAEADWEGRRIGEGAGTAIVDLTPRAGDVPAAGRVTLGLDGAGAMTMRTDGATLAGGPIEWAGQLTLGTWIPTWRLRSDGVAIGVVHRMLTGWVGSSVWPAGLEGSAALDLRLHGPFRNLTVVGDVTAAPLRLGDVAVDSAQGFFTLEAGKIALDGVRLALGRGTAAVGGDVDLLAGGALRLAVTGNRLPLGALIGWGGVRLPIDGQVGVAGSLSGTIAEPAFEARLQFAKVVVAGVPFGDGSGDASLAAGTIRVDHLAVGPFSSQVEIDLRGRQVGIDASLRRFGLEGISPLLARIAGDALDLELHGVFPFDHPAGRLAVSSAEGAHGVVELDQAGLRIDLERKNVWAVRGTISGTGGTRSGRFDYEVSSLEALASDVAGAPLPVSGRVAGSASLTFGPRGAIELRGAISTLDTTVGGDAMAATHPIDFTIAGSAIDIPEFSLAGPAGRLDGHVHRSADGGLDVRVQGRVPATLVGLLWPEAKLGGVGDVTVEVSGTDLSPVIVGRAQVHDGSILLPGLPAPLTHVEGTLDFVPEAIRLDDMAFSLGSGSGSMSGRILIEPRIELDIDARVADVRWPVMTGFVPGLTGRIRVVGPLTGLAVSGDTTLQRTVFREEINLQRLVLQQLLTPERTVAATGTSVALNLNVAVPGTLDIETPLARLTLRGQVRVTGTSLQPGLVGRLEAMPGGEVELSGQQFDLDRASATFSDPERIAPYLDLLGRTVVQTVEITVGLNGTLDRLTPTLVSNPPLAETDILALLSTGRRADAASTAQAGALAGSFLTEELAGVVTRRARTLLDVDQLRVDPFAATETGSPTARVTVVKQLSRDWMVTLSTNLATNREEVIQSRWRLGPALYLEASRDIDGSYSLEVRWRHRY